MTRGIAEVVDLRLPLSERSCVEGLRELCMKLARNAEVLGGHVAEPGGPARPRRAMSAPHHVGEPEELVRVGLQEELLPQHRVSVGQIRDGVRAEGAEDATPRVDFLDVVGAPPADSEAPLPHSHVEVVAAVQLSKLLGGEARPEERLRACVGCLTLLVTNGFSPTREPIADVLAPVVVVVAPAQAFEPGFRAVASPLDVCLGQASTRVPDR